MITFPLPHLPLLFLFISLPSYNTRLVHLVSNDAANTTRERNGLKCAEEEAGHRKISATILLVLAGLGCLANMLVMIIILAKKRVRRWSLGLIFHQCAVDCARASILIPLGRSLLECQPVLKCSLLETAFLLLATVSTVSTAFLLLANVKYVDAGNVVYGDHSLPAAGHGDYGEYSFPAAYHGVYSE